MKKNVFKKGLIFGLIVLFVGAGIIPSIVGVKKEKTTITTLYFPGYIQNLIDNASDGDTIFIPSGIYYENIVINKSISLIGEDKNNTIIDGSSNGTVIHIKFVDYVNVSGFTIKNSGNNLERAGIWLQFSNRTSISGNIISNNFFGIYLEQSNNNTIINNSFFNDGLIVIESYQNNITNNIVNGKPLVFLEEELDREIDEDAGQIILINCNNITIQNQNLSNLEACIFLWNTDNCNITGNIITSNNFIGLWVYKGSDNNQISDNTISNSIYGIPIGLNSNNNTVTDNTVYNNECGIFPHGVSENNIFMYNSLSNNLVGFLIHSANSNIITSNNITSSGDIGIEIRLSNDNTITDNHIFNNGRLGIFINCSNNNSINGNIINSNNEEGIYLINSSYNSIKGNSISENEDGIELEDSNSNTITENNISLNNDYGIEFIESPRKCCFNNMITGNNIISNVYGIYFEKSCGNKILINNFIDNQRHAFFMNCKNTWDANYWNRPRFLPKPIFGFMKIGSISIPWVNFDLHPASKPNEV